MNDLVGSVSVVEDRGMEPTLMRDDVVLVAKWPIKVWRDYKKGDVVLLKSPQGDHTSTTVVKRLTGTEREWRVSGYLLCMRISVAVEWNP
jgi:signal peptidase I